MPSIGYIPALPVLPLLHFKVELKRAGLSGRRAVAQMKWLREARRGRTERRVWELLPSRLHAKPSHSAHERSQLAAMLSAADSDFLPWLLLIAFGGVRREELAKGLRWEALNFETKTILVPANIAKTGKKRKIDMADNLAEWLQPYAGRTGPIFTIDPRKRMAKVTDATGIAWRKNALRHSFGSYMMEKTRNAGAVALAMGNSPVVVMRHYHEIVTAKDAQSFWDIRPADKGKVIEMGRKSAA